MDGGMKRGRDAGRDGGRKGGRVGGKEGGRDGWKKVRRYDRKLESHESLTSQMRCCWKY